MAARRDLVHMHERALHTRIPILYTTYRYQSDQEEAADQVPSNLQLTMDGKFWRDLWLLLNLA